MSLLVNYANSDDESNQSDDSFEADITTNQVNAKNCADTHTTNHPNLPAAIGSASLRLPEPKNKNSNKDDYVDNLNFNDTKSVNIQPTYSEMFKKLPTTSNKIDLSLEEEENVEMIILPTETELKLREVPPAKTKRKIVISLPSFNNSDSEDEEKTVQPPPRKQHHGSSLFALLPEPTLIPRMADGRVDRKVIPPPQSSTSFKPKSSPSTTATLLQPRTLKKTTTTTTAAATTTTKITTTTTKTTVNESCINNSSSSEMDTATSITKPTDADTISSSNTTSESSASSELVKAMPKNPNFFGLLGTYDDDDEDDDDETFSDVDDKKIANDDNDDGDVKNSECVSLSSSTSRGKNTIDDVTDDPPIIGPQRGFFVNDDDDDDDDEDELDNERTKMAKIHSASLYNYSNMVADDDAINYGDGNDDASNNDDNVTDDDVTRILTKEQLERLQGRPNKKQESSISFIDVKISDHIGQYELDRTKNLSIEAEKVSYSKTASGVPTSQQKRKHQITYLAHQAKEREFELKNQWAENRFNKRQTQSKYGF
ncbi:hypothetical protein HELRODRAFT_159819 [Helobdella robusta]|uniref:Proline-rich protein PRCC n=1 Tax=Helobdella robusta TaxID=6412 RepID=T1EPF9_HELRO|nr:hypothetical protein HELRODRAFT_159819 [Helobdella robusta]ESO13188.1 hypothetical protein HELRODRAFT_159819 [Helobdella robusta]